ncbi:hypothetical protein [Synechococcus sp. MU1655]|uniref:hypothetical protein n=1 Tax=Synechococcus sp. MU1655 TaxID=2508355 RepID=UPI00202614C7|nr:hypothetical protein [Synechococcus sp. MU1655]
MTGTSDGKGEPTYEFAFRDGGPIRRMLEEVYDEGLYSTGSVGQVRDMVFAMSRVAEELGYELEIPEATQAKVEIEAKHDLEQLPEGAVF